MKLFVIIVYASEVRYPNILEIEDYHMHSAIKDANIIKDFIQGKLEGFQQLNT
jgi:hypothetical protein